jgi:hypothetical protein
MMKLSHISQVIHHGVHTLKSTTQRFSGTDALAMQGWQQMRGPQTAVSLQAQQATTISWELQMWDFVYVSESMVRMHTVRRTASLQPAKLLRILCRATWADQQRRD